MDKIVITILAILSALTPLQLFAAPVQPTPTVSLSELSQRVDHAIATALEKISAPALMPEPSLAAPKLKTRSSSPAQLAVPSSTKTHLHFHASMGINCDLLEDQSFTYAGETVSCGIVDPEATPPAPVFRDRIIYETPLDKCACTFPAQQFYNINTAQEFCSNVVEQIRSSIYQDALVIKEGNIIVADLRPCYRCSPPWCIVHDSCTVQKPCPTVNPSNPAPAACGGFCTTSTKVPQYSTVIPEY